MKSNLLHVSTDIETTGLDPDTCNVVEFAAIIDDLSNPKPKWELPVFHKYVRYPIYNGTPYALSLHSNIFKKIHDGGDDVVDALDLFWHFEQFLIKKYKNYSTKKVLFSGKNFSGFDKQFLLKIPGFKNFFDNYAHHRSVDIATHYMIPSDTFPPSLDECTIRAGLDGKVNHTATNDAMMVVELIRDTFLEKKQILKLDDSLFDGLLSGNKNVTIRKGYRDIKLGKLTFEGVSTDIITDVNVVEVSHTTAKKLLPEFYIYDGFTSTQDMINKMKKYYPDFDVDTEVTAIKFESV